MNDEIMLRMNEDGSFGLYEPFANIECETEEDFVHLCEMVKLGESIVRCGDCVYKENATVNKKGYLICPASGMEITDQDYCSYGERRDNRE